MFVILHASLNSNAGSPAPAETIVKVSSASTSTHGNASTSASDASGIGFAYTSEHLLQLNSRSVEWTKISKSEKEKLGLTFEDDGEFW